MKIVVTNSQVAHLWANQSQPHAHSDSMSFKGLNLYSYSTCIAAFHAAASPVAQSERIVLISSRKYSATTSSKHMPRVRDALRGLGLQSYTVPEVYNSNHEAPSFSLPSLSARAHSINQSFLSAQYKDYAAKLMRALSLGDWQLEELTRRMYQARGYARAFGLEVPQFSQREDWSNAQARQTRLANDPKRAARIAARERANAARAEREAIARVQMQTRQLAEFRAGIAGSYYLTDKDGAAYLRLREHSPFDGGSIVQTSRGASVPVADALRAIRFIDVIRARGADWKRNGEQCPVGQFQVDRIAANGDIHAGCHFIKWSEIEALRMQITQAVALA